MNKPTGDTLRAKGSVSAQVFAASPPPAHPPFNTEQVEMIVSPLIITGKVEGDNRQITFFFHEAYADGTYTLPMRQSYTWGRYTNGSIMYYSESGTMNLEVSNGGSVYKGGFKQVKFKQDGDLGNAHCILDASFDATIIG